MYDARGVKVLDATQHLVEQIGQPLVVQLHLNHLAQVGIHQLHHNIPGDGYRGEGRVDDITQKGVQCTRIHSQTYAYTGRRTQIQPHT